MLGVKVHALLRRSMSFKFCSFIFLGKISSWLLTIVSFPIFAIFLTLCSFLALSLSLSVCLSVYILLFVGELFHFIFWAAVLSLHTVFHPFTLSLHCHFVLLLSVVYSALEFPCSRFLVSLLCFVVCTPLLSFHLPCSGFLFFFLLIFLLVSLNLIFSLFFPSHSFGLRNFQRISATHWFLWYNYWFSFCSALSFYLHPPFALVCSFIVYYLCCCCCCCFCFYQFYFRISITFMNIHTYTYIYAIVCVCVCVKSGGRGYASVYEIL